MVLRLSGVRRNARLPALSPDPSYAHPAGGRSGPRALETVPDHQGELPAQVLARYFGADRLRTAQGADHECARRSGVALAAAAPLFQREAWAADPHQRDTVRRLGGSRRVVGLSAALAVAADDLADG